MNTVDRDQMARQAALLQLAAAHDRWSEEEQLLVEEGKYDDAQESHEIACFLLRAYRAELDDPTPAMDAFDGGHSDR